MASPHSPRSPRSPHSLESVTCLCGGAGRCRSPGAMGRRGTGDTERRPGRSGLGGGPGRTVPLRPPKIRVLPLQPRPTASPGPGWGRAPCAVPGWSHDRHRGQPRSPPRRHSALQPLIAVQQPRSASPGSGAALPRLGRCRRRPQLPRIQSPSWPELIRFLRPPRLSVVRVLPGKGRRGSASQPERRRCRHVGGQQRRRVVPDGERPGRLHRAH